MTVSDPVNPTPFEATFTVSVPIGQDFTATATDSTNDTSQLAAAVTAAGLYTVITTEDNTDPGSLRTVIANANAASTPVTITFAIPTSASSPSGVCIELLSPLGPITNQVTINGINTLDPNASAVPDVQIDGSVHNVAGDGLVFSFDAGMGTSSAGSTINDLAFTGFATSQAPRSGLETDNNTLTGNWLGIGIPGTIGGTGAGSANVIALNTSAGIEISGSVAPGEPRFGQLHRHRFECDPASG